MDAEQLLYALTGIRDGLIREAVPDAAAPQRRRWPWAAALAACLCLVLLIARTHSASPAENETGGPGDNPTAGSEVLPPADAGDSGDGGGSPGPGAAPPSLTVDGVTYVISSHFGMISAECPEGFTHAGETTPSYSDSPLPYYTNPERPEWVYVYQECYDQRKQAFYMGYVRYVEEVLRGLNLVRYQGTVYVFLNDTYYLPYQTDVDPEDQARYDAVPYASVLKEPPAGFAPVGKTVLDEYDLVPVSELGSNNMPGRQVLANPAEPDILLLRNYWSGLKGPDYWVFVRYQG